MNIKSITYPDVNNGLGCRVTLWVTGCTHHCPFCHNAELWDSNVGRKFTEEDEEKIYEILKLPYMKGLTVSGGDPLAPYNRKDVMRFCSKVKIFFPDKDIWLYTGYQMEQIQNSDSMKPILYFVDYIVDGLYDNNLRDISLKFRGSTNQTIWEKYDIAAFKVSDLNN
jgi:anaerobic ribonucleoside-triphosphate reductase activating protein